MPITSPQLDDLTYDRIVTELIRRIPVYSPEWTDFNDSDPGITLIQLFAYLTEMVGYRLNQVPQKSQVNLLQLLGVTLNPATTASTQLALLLTDPTKLAAYTLAKGASVTASTGSPPPAFETEQDVPIVPIEPAVMATTKNRDIRRPWYPPEHPRDRTASDYLTVVWDGQSPKLKDMPLAPVVLAPTPSQRHLWIGINLNGDPSAGALGARVQLTFQFDADEQPSSSGAVRSGLKQAAAQHGNQIDWLWYYDAIKKEVIRVPGRIDDSTNRLANSGALTFTMPSTIGPIPAVEFPPLFEPQDPSARTIYARNLRTAMSGLPPPPSPVTAAWVTQYTGAITKALDDTVDAVNHEPPGVPNPLDPKFYGTMGWLCIDLNVAPGALPRDTSKLRIATFNAVGATNSTTVQTRSSALPMVRLARPTNWPMATFNPEHCRWRSRRRRRTAIRRWCRGRQWPASMPTDRSTASMCSMRKWGRSRSETGSTAVFRHWCRKAAISLRSAMYGAAARPAMSPWVRLRS
jgi:hypothetical protein